MFLHYGDCPLWSDDAARCACPREWRIVRDRNPTDPEYPWLVLRRVTTHSSYELFVRASTHAKALSLVTALIAFDRSYLHGV